MGMLEKLFPGLPPTPGDVLDGIGDFFEGIADFFGGSGPSDESIAVGKLVKRVLSGPGARGLYEAQRATRRQVDLQIDLAGQAHELVTRLESAWAGQSSYGARQVIHSFADVADESSRVLASNARNIESQVDGFERMRNSLEPMPEPPPRKGSFDPDFSGAKKRRIRRYEQQAARNRDRYAGYVDETRDNTDAMSDRYGDLPGERGSRPGWRPGREPVYPGGGSGPIRVPGFPGGGGSGYPGGSGYDPGRYTGTDDWNQRGNVSPGYDGTTAAASFGPGGAATGAGGLGGAGFGPGTGGTAGAGGPNAAGGMSGVAGGLAGAGGAGAAGAGAAGRGAAGAGRAGGMMGGAGGAGRGQGGDDQDHERKSWLQENDPEGIFGTDELTPPPVIGDDEYE